jgi:Zn-finger nucleic acid-binding protein
MKKGNIGGVLADKCSNCGGIWLDSGELESIQSGDKKERQELVEEAKRELVQEKNRLLTTVGLCPKCQKEPLSILHRSGVELDGCPHCGGLFFDKGELEKIIENEKDNGSSTPLAGFLKRIFGK